MFVGAEGRAEPLIWGLMPVVGAGAEPLVGAWTPVIGNGGRVGAGAEPFIEV